MPVYTPAFLAAHHAFLASLFLRLCSAVLGARSLACTSGEYIFSSRCGIVRITPARSLSTDARSAAKRLAVSSRLLLIFWHCALPFFAKLSLGSAARRMARAVLACPALCSESMRLRSGFAAHFARSTALDSGDISVAPSPPAVMLVKVPTPRSARPSLCISNRSKRYAEKRDGTPNTLNPTSRPYFLNTALQNGLRCVLARCGFQRVGVLPMPT